MLFLSSEVLMRGISPRTQGDVGSCSASEMLRGRNGVGVHILRKFRRVSPLTVSRNVICWGRYIHPMASISVYIRCQSDYSDDGVR